MNKGVKFRIYPNKEQQNLINQTLGCCRLVYNLGLDMNKYFVVLTVEFKPEVKQNNGVSIGVDVGIKEFYSDSNGNVVSNPRFLEKSSRKLRREQRRLSRKKKDSNNRNKQRIRVARVYEKITNQRNDFLQKISTMLISENQVICNE